MSFAQWVNEVEKPAIARIRRQEWWVARPNLSARLRWAAKQAGLMIVMMGVTFVIVSIETGHYDAGAKVAAVAGPLKAIASALYHRFVG